MTRALSGTLQSMISHPSPVVRVFLPNKETRNLFFSLPGIVKIVVAIEMILGGKYVEMMLARVANH
jgi:hypothetical protein